MQHFEATFIKFQFIIYFIQLALSPFLNLKPFSLVCNEQSNMTDDHTYEKDSDFTVDPSILELNENQRTQSCPVIEGKTLRQKIESYLESRSFHIFVLILTVLDMIIVSVTLTVSEYVFKNDLNTRKKFIFGLQLTSIIILSTFLFELAIKMCIYKKKFFKKPLELFDAGIIVSSLVLEVVHLIPVFKAPAVEFLIIGRLWRVAALVNGTFYSINTAKNRMIDKLKKNNDAIRAENSRLRTRLECLIAEGVETGRDTSSNESVISLADV